MNEIYDRMKSIAFISALAITAATAHGQSRVLTLAQKGNITLQCEGSTANRSGIAFNPKKKLYYSVDCGNAGYPMETFDEQGHKLQSLPQGFDYRGLWWNPNTDQLEGNGFDRYGYCTQTLDVNGYPLGAVSHIVIGQYQPSDQSCSTYNSKDNEVIDYANGRIYRYTHDDGILLGSVKITGLPCGEEDIDSTSISYTGCAGLEYCIYDFNHKAVHFISKDGKFVSTSVLPPGASAPDRFRFTFCNGYAWVFDDLDFKWINYKVIEIDERKYAITQVSVNIIGQPLCVGATQFEKTKDQKTPDATLTLFDSKGNKVKQVPVFVDELHIDHSELAAGTYLYLISSGNKQIASGKLVVE